MSEIKGVTKHIHEGKSYLPLVDYQTWRVALLREDENLTPWTIPFFERHNETDEVFVLLEGSCMLIWTEEEKPALEDMRAEIMKPGVVYNVTRGTWHSSALTEETQVLIVENVDTNDDNSEYYYLTPAQKQRLQDLAEQCCYPLGKEEKI